MDVTYEAFDYKGNPKQETQQITEFLYDELLFSDSRGLDRDKIRLEDQPKQVCQALGRLVEILIKKNVLDLEDLKTIADCGWGRKSDSLAIKKEE
jgi:hypothetical protein